MWTEPALNQIDAYRRGFTALGAGACAPAMLVPAPAIAASARTLDLSAAAALKRLHAANENARALSTRARGVLVFPKITKAGFVVSGREGEGVLWARGAANAYYRIAAASFGLQDGAQMFSLAMFFISQSALDYLGKSQARATGAGPDVVVADCGTAKYVNTATLSQDVYAMAFGQKGLIAATALAGTKIARIHPGP